jgi:hypothetical protein
MRVMTGLIDFLFSVSILKVFNNRPGLSLVEHDYFLALPIRSDHIAWRSVVNCWHLVREKLNWRLFVTLSNSAFSILKDVDISEEVTTEATKDHNFVVAYLCTSSTLSHWELSFIYFDYLPNFRGALRFWVEAFYWVEVFFSSAWDSRKYVNPSIFQSAWWVVVSAKV